jgi:two-component system sensor histidine kinase YesM
MIVITILILIMIVLLVEVVIYSVDIPVQMDNAIQSHSQEVRYISERVDAAIINYDWFLNSLTMNEELQTLLQKPYHSSLEESLLNYDLEQTLRSITILSNGRFENIFLYDTEKFRSFVINEHNFDQRLLSLNTIRYENEGNVQWIVEGDKVYIQRAILDRKSFQLIGYITMSVSDDYLKGLMRSAVNGYTFIFNENDHLVIQDRDEQMDTAKILLESNRLKEGESTVVSIASQGDMLLTSYKSQFSLWTTVSLVPLSIITAGANLMAKWIIGIGLAGILLGTLIIWFSSNRLIRPLKQLIRVMERVEQDNFNVRVDIGRNDEFGRLSLSFNRMMRKIDTLISEVYHKEISQKEAEYKALKAQINPHFLYNTLETIRSLAEFGENEKVEMVTVALGKLMKASINNSSDLIPISEELAYIDAYLSIQNTRFQNKVNVSIQVEETILNEQVPRFILQPLVENAFVHGLENKLGRGSLIINGSLGGETIKFQIIDDGVGMEALQVNELLVSNRPTPSGRRGTGNGILNVHNRILIIYGEPYGLKIQSSPNIGTNIEVNIPIRKDNGGKLDVQSSHH